MEWPGSTKTVFERIYFPVKSPFLAQTRLAGCGHAAMFKYFRSQRSKLNETPSKVVVRRENIRVQSFDYLRQVRYSLLCCVHFHTTSKVDPIHKVITPSYFTTDIYITSFVGTTYFEFDLISNVLKRICICHGFGWHFTRDWWLESLPAPSPVACNSPGLYSVRNKRIQSSFHGPRARSLVLRATIAIGDKFNFGAKKSHKLTQRSSLIYLRFISQHPLLTNSKLV